VHMADGRGCQRGGGLKCCVVSREGRERTAPPSAAVLASHFAVANCCAHGSEQPAYQSWVLVWKNWVQNWCVGAADSLPRLALCHSKQ
jgi:hypothetical protein